MRVVNQVEYVGLNAAGNTPAPVIMNEVAAAVWAVRENAGIRILTWVPIFDKANIIVVVAAPRTVIVVIAPASNVHTCESKVVPMSTRSTKLVTVSMTVICLLVRTVVFLIPPR